VIFHVFGNIDEVAYRGHELGLSQDFQVGHEREEQILPCGSGIRAILDEEVRADLFEQPVGG
jgi:hypothetical protein